MFPPLKKLPKTMMHNPVSSIWPQSPLQSCHLSVLEVASCEQLKCMFLSDDLFCIDTHKSQDRIVSSIVLQLGHMSGVAQGQDLWQPLLEWGNSA